MSKVLVCGSSYIRRLQDYVRESHFHCRGKPVHWIGRPGAKIQTIWQELRRRPVLTYSVVVIMVGSNDLCNFSRRPADVTNDLLALSENLLSRGVTKVVICQLLHRRSRSHFQGLRDVKEYNDRVDDTNNLLAEKCKGNVSFWTHEHGVRGRQHQCRDGIHLNAKGLKSFRYSIMNAMLKAEKSISRQ